MMITPLLMFVGFFLSYFFTKFFMKKIEARGFMGKDIHKTKDVRVPNFGGVGFVFAYILILFIYLFYSTYTNNPINTIEFLAVISSIMIMGFIAYIDDTLKFNWTESIIMPFIASLPLIAAKVGSTSMFTPVLGQVDFGLTYFFLVIPLFFVFSSNATNMLAGYNGLEVGLAMINAFFLGVFSYINGISIGYLLSFLFVGTAFGFYILNRYPSKTFPGDVANYSWGTILATIILIANIKTFGFLVMASLYGTNFLLFLFMMYKVKTKKIKYSKFAKVTKEGYIKPENPYTLYWLFPSYFKLTEKQTTRILWTLQSTLNVIFLLILL